ncbi:MAG: hypothetical protein MJ162_02490 [Treponema sp.]|nr:hypothetical protein [Treponema sp.]
MITIFVGIVLIAFTIFSVLPMGPLAWGPEVIAFLKGCVPVLSAFIGLICFFVGAADIKDKKEAKIEEAQEAENDFEGSKD